MKIIVVGGGISHCSWGCRHKTQNNQEDSSQGACKKEIRALPAAQNGA